MKTLQINGPFYTNYSLSRMNRGFALALDKIQDDYKVTLGCTQDKIDYWPSDVDLDKKPELKKLFDKNCTFSDVVIYNNFPKTLTELNDLKDLPGKVKLMYVAWEESIYPKHWVDEINENLHGVMTISEFTKEILQKSGVKVPIKAVPIALDDKHRKEFPGDYPLKTNKKFKFLHISTGKLRKGVDILLKAYFNTFTKDDDVVLVFKSFPSPDNNIDELIRSLRNENSPEVIHINNPDLTEEEISRLISSCDCSVYPSRAEGFGLPALESMYHNVPVIATNYSGLLEFCNEDDAFLIDYKIVPAKDSELINIGSKWAEPNEQDLEKLMRHIYELRIANDESELQTKIANARKTAEKFSWENTAKMALEFVKEIEEIAPLKTKNAGVLSFMNNESGIADYTEDLYRSVEKSFANFYYLSNKDVVDRSVADQANVVRTWSTGESDFSETLDFVKEHNIQIFHIQYHSGTYFPPTSLDELIKRLKDNNVKTFVTLHAVKGKGFNFIKECHNLGLADKVIIHNANDYNYAKETLKNLYLMQLPTVKFRNRNKGKLKAELGLDKFHPIVATHGLLNINKSVPQIVEAVSILKKDYPEILLLALNAVSANNIYAQGLYEEIQTQVKKLNLEKNFVMLTDFLSDEFIELFLQASDVNVFAYTDIAGESSSAAIRKGLASLNPVITTDINMFQEFKSEVLKIKDNSPEAIVEGIRKVLNDKALAESLIESTKKYVEANSYESRGVETLGIYTQA